MTPRLVPSLLALCGFLAACQVPAGGPGKAGLASRRPAATGPASPAASASPTEAGSPAPGGSTASDAPPAPAPAAADLLQRPPGAVRTLTGKVKLDASYVVGAAAGGLVTTGGASVLGAGRGARLTGGGSPALTLADGRIVATGRGNIVSNNGSSIIANNGGSLISDKGAGLVTEGKRGTSIGNNGGGLIGNNGGGLISDKGAGYALAQAAAGPPGEVLAAAGVSIAVRSMRTGAYLPLGVDGAGKPVHVVFTDLAGGFEVFLPEAEAANLIVEAHVAPETPDPRLGYRLVSGVGPDLDEDTVVVTDGLRRSFAERLAIFFGHTDRADALKTVVDVDRSPPGMAPVLEENFGKLWDAANASGLTREPDPAIRLAYAYAVTDACLRSLDFGAIMLDPASGWAGPPEPAVPAMVDVIAGSRRAATARMAEDRDYFPGQPWFQALGERLVASGRRSSAVAIQRPSDLSRLVVEEYMLADPRGTTSFEPPVTRPEECGTGSTVCNSSLLGLRSLFARIGVPDGDRQVDRLVFAQQAVVIATVLNFAFAMPPAEREDVLGIVRRYPPNR